MSSKFEKLAPDHPIGNPVTERFNRTLLQILRTLTIEQKANWKSFVPALVLVHAYNSTHNHNTGYSPFYLMFGRQPRLAIDVILGLTGGESNNSIRGYVENLQEQLGSAYRIASEARKLSVQRHK